MASSAARASCRSSSAKPAASPMLMPLRRASKGRHGSRETRPSDAKPHSTLWHNASTPPTTTASTRPRRSQRSATANTLALDEQAVDTVTAGPPRPSASATNIAGACGVFSRGERQRAGKPPSAAGAR